MMGPLDLMAVARNIVNQLSDQADVPVEKRQGINDVCIDFVLVLLMRCIEDVHAEVARWKGLAGRVAAGAVSTDDWALLREAAEGSR